MALTFTSVPLSNQSLVGVTVPPASAFIVRKYLVVKFAMYVAGEITGATVQGEVATLTGTANVTGLGAGTDVPFNFVVRDGGPGATAVLTVLEAAPEKVRTEVFNVGFTDQNYTKKQLVDELTTYFAERSDPERVGADENAVAQEWLPGIFHFPAKSVIATPAAT